MIKLILKIIIMAILLVASYLILGVGATTFTIGLALKILTSFATILGSTVSGSPDISAVVSFITNIVIGFGILFGYYIVAHFISKIIIRD